MNRTVMSLRQYRASVCTVGIMTLVRPTLRLASLEKLGKVGLFLNARANSIPYYGKVDYMFYTW